MFKFSKNLCCISLNVFSFFSCCNYTSFLFENQYNLILNSFATGSIKSPEISTEDPKGKKGASVDVMTANQLGHPTSPVMTLTSPAIMQGHSPGMPPLQPPPGMTNPHMPPFLSPPSMPQMPPQMIPGGPMFPSDRFRMPMPFPPRGPPFHRHPSMGPESINDREGRQFRNARPGFGCPPFHRGRW